jgi:hypothetical protein
MDQRSNEGSALGRYEFLTGRYGAPRRSRTTTGIIPANEPITQESGSGTAVAPAAPATGCDFANAFRHTT